MEQPKPSNVPDQGKKDKDRVKPEEKETATQKSIDAARQLYCTNLRASKANQKAGEKAYERSVKIYRKKKRLFEWTENNYRIYRDLDICLDTELATGNAALTANVVNYNKVSAALYANLTQITAAVKTLKTKVSALRDQASVLENYKNDQCNAAQWAILTGKNMENCKTDAPLPVPRERPEACKEADKIYEELIQIPKKLLVFDVDSLLQSSADVTGIQTFSNVAVLTKLQTDLTTASTALVTQIQAAVKARTADMATVQADLITSVQDCTKTGVDEYNKISLCHAAHFSVQFLCQPDCGCVKPWQETAIEPRLEDCECRICRIGEVVRSVYRGGPVE
ncbi:MAG TPA: hypothetical protein VKQ52_05885 [Puia sp.]|nr:hypothetical protein [Puia sp.]